MMLAQGVIFSKFKIVQSSGVGQSAVSLYEMAVLGLEEIDSQRFLL